MCFLFVTFITQYSKLSRIKLFRNVVTQLLNSSAELSLIQSRNISLTSIMSVENVGGSGAIITFHGNGDRFNGITVDSTVERCNADEFPSKLSESLKQWTASNRRGIWFKVALEDSSWVPVLTQNGFRFHHARETFVMLYKWLPKQVCNVPPYAHTMIGVGAVVVNDKNQVLVVKEKYFVTPHWKLPGGYVEPGENFIDAAIREVFEETKIKTKFNSLISLRHTHGSMFDCSDIYFVCNLTPLTDQIEKCDREIEQCEWMDIQEYLNHPNVYELNRFFIQKYLEYKENKVKIGMKEGIHQILKKEYTVYSIAKLEDM